LKVARYKRRTHHDRSVRYWFAWGILCINQCVQSRQDKKIDDSLKSRLYNKLDTHNNKLTRRERLAGRIWLFLPVSAENSFQNVPDVVCFELLGCRSTCRSAGHPATHRWCAHAATHRWHSSHWGSATHWRQSTRTTDSTPARWRWSSGRRCSFMQFGFEKFLEGIHPLM